ncbi:phosphotransferase [Candidatus Epulonipiscium fishelsonii]|uniref:Phosphotransferase n=1 Tax=Candidatus Epulonipiscium fishelsonii TaxID=77094 RepID=A0ACC8XGH2_9FIRM|nr:phosphotransferase [Epulopiscium sp. SCG-B05WGA-EpuloA1]ONI42770.1 phosphotransferase [Epulopiscium sp. SCG-B11WGA-EpuloA1]
MESIIKSVASQVFNTSKNEIILKERLMGGLSNKIFIFELDKNLYTFRISGKNSEKFVNREIEYKNIELIKSLNINSQNIYFDTDTGYKIAKYVPGYILSNFEKPENYLKEVSKLLKTVHTSNLKSENNYEPYERLQTYEGYLNEFNYKHDELYIQLKNEFFKNKIFLDTTTLVLCHNDCQLSNIVVGKDNTYLLDWEFSGNNDPFYDIACVGNKEIGLGIKLLGIYLGYEPTIDQKNRVYLWRIFQYLQWYNVALYKYLIGLGEELNINFKVVADLYLKKIIYLFKLIE